MPAVESEMELTQLRKNKKGKTHTIETYSSISNQDVSDDDNNYNGNNDDDLTDGEVKAMRNKHYQQIPQYSQTFTETAFESEFQQQNIEPPRETVELQVIEEYDD
eukprot:497723_1